MSRPIWQQRYRNQASSRAAYIHPKIYGATPPPKQRRFSLRISLRVWAVLSALAALGAIVWLLFLSPAFVIRRIDVIGSVTPDVLQTFQVLQGRNLLAYSTGSMGDQLRSEQSSIRDLRVTKGLPDTLRIEVGLRAPALRWRSGSEEVLIDTAGVPFKRGTGLTETSGTESAPLVVDTHAQTVTLGTPLVRAAFVALIVKLGQDFPVRFPVSIDHFEIGESTFEVRLVTTAGWSVLVDTTRAIDPQLDAFGQVFTKYHDEIHQYVDLRVEGRAYYQ